MKSLERLLLTGGGTAGHVNPALAIGRAVAGTHTSILYVGVRGRAEAEIVPREGLPIRFVRSAGYPGSRPSPALARFLVNVGIGTLQASRILLSFRPDTIVGTGGYASAPVLFAAAALRRLGLCRARIFVHEQNAAPGKLNQVVGRLADRVFVTFPETLASFPGNAVVSGYPLRRRIAGVDPEAARAALDFHVPAGRRVVFVFGGSQGARTINRAIVDALRDLLPHRDRLFVIHGTGLERPGYKGAEDVQRRIESSYSEDERRALAGFYVSRPYFHQIENVYALADLVVARAGAGSLYEIASLGLPAIVIPKANLPGDHQVMNARAMARGGGARVIYEETLAAGGEIVEQVDGRALAATIVELLQDDEARLELGRRGRAFLRGDALAIIAEAIRGQGSDGANPDGMPNGHGLAAPASPAASTPPISDRALVVGLEKALSHWGDRYCPEHVIPSADDRTYFISRAASLLASESWEQRNLGVKLLGLLHARERIPLLLALLADKRPAPLLQRLAGGDYLQVGFVRRNVVAAFARMGVVTPGVEAAIVASFADPYFEVRAEAARTAQTLASRLHDRRSMVGHLRGLLQDRWVEVAEAAAEAIGHVGGGDDGLPALLELSETRFWKVRAGALRGLIALVERGEAGDGRATLAAIDRFVLSSTDFKPEFQIKRLYGRLREAIVSREGETR
jgi:UDP-N-acetylglucosamine--N-acetylmuramyl-(pentapeptide) pyrophosphoryl-undecaprenol N-acetylglucosamine transferase